MSTNMKPTTTAASPQKELSNNPAAENAALQFSIEAKHVRFTDLQLYALRFWYDQYHILDHDAPRARFLSAEKIVEVLLSKMEKYEVEIFRERLNLILAHYPERARWNKKMWEGLGGGYGLKAKVMENIWGEKYLQVNWEEVTDEEKEFKWWW